MSSARFGPFSGTAPPRVYAALRVAIGVLSLLAGVELVWSAAPLILYLPWFLGSLALIAGVRFAALGMAILGAVVVLTFFKNHLYLLELVLILLAWSGPARWPLQLMQLQVSFVYVGAALAKVNSSFLSGQALENFFARSMFGLPEVHITAPLAVTVVCLEAFMGVAVWTRLRPLVFGLALPFHIGTLLVADRPLYLFGIALFACITMTLLATFVDTRERVVVWDASCSFCRRWVTWFGRLDGFGALRFVPNAYGDISADEAMHVVLPGGEVRSGFDAVRAIVEVLPGGYLVAPWMALPGVRQLGHSCYRRVAAMRTCAYDGGAA